MGKRGRRDLRRLYGMEEVSEDIYNTIMRAENGKATDGDYRILDQYMKEKTQEIRQLKVSLGIEGGGRARHPGRVAENIFINMPEMKRRNTSEEEDGDE